MGDTKSDGQKLPNSNHYTGRLVTIEREYMVVDQLKGECVEVNDSGIMIRYTERKQTITDLVPWAHVKRVRHSESDMARRSRSA